MKNKTQENEKKTIIPKQKKQRTAKKEKSAVTKKTAKKTRNGSMAVKLVAILVLMVAVTMVSNVINYDAMVKMTFSVNFKDTFSFISLPYRTPVIKPSLLNFFAFSSGFLFSAFNVNITIASSISTLVWCR